jgi:O-antigen ligase
MVGVNKTADPEKARFLRTPERLVTEGRFQGFLRTSSALRMGLIGLALVASLILGMPSFETSAPYYPLIVGGIIPAAIALMVALTVWARHPVYSLYATLFVVFLPRGLIPVDIHSFLNRFFTIVTLASFLMHDRSMLIRSAVSVASLLMVGFIVWGCVTLFWAENVQVGATTLLTYTLRLILFLLLLCSGIKTEKEMDGLMKILALNGWGFVAIALGLIVLEGYEPGARFKVLEENENSIVMFASFGLQGVLWHSIKPSEKYQAVKKLMGGIFLSMTILLVSISGSRGGAISLVITLFAFCLFKPTRPWGKLGVGILVLAAITAPSLFTTTVQRFAGTQGETVLGGREELWEAGWKLITEQPLLGVGIGNSTLKLQELTTTDWELDIGDVGKPIHNPVLVVWSETGMVGLTLYLGVLANAVWSFIGLYLRSRRLRMQWLTRYFALIGSVFLGYMASWIKGGGMESDFVYFLMLGLLLIPTQLYAQGLKGNERVVIENLGGTPRKK